MDITCWPHALHMVIQGRVHSSQHRPSVGVYKIDYFVKSSLSSSLMLPNTRLLLQQPLTGTALIVCLLQQSSQQAIQQWGLQENSTRSPHCIDPLYILQAPGPCYNNINWPLCLCIILMSYYSSTCVFLKATMLPTCALTSYS